MDLRALVLRSLSGDNATRREAEQILGQCEVQAGFTVTLLQLVSQVSNGSALSPEDAAVRQSMSVLFKNVIRRRWMPGEDEDRSAMIPAGDRETIKTHLVELMCSTPPEVQKMLAEAVAIVAKSDFPANWTGLLVQLKAKLATQDLSIVKGVMLTTNSIMKRFRYVYKTDPLMLELIYCLEQFQEPLTQCANSNFALIESMGAVPTNKPALIFAMETHRLINRIFFSLNWQDIPEYFEDNIKTWMEGFARMLNYKNPVLDDPDEDDEPGAIEKVQAAVVENISLYVTKYEEEFGPYLGNFTQLVWQRLMELGPQPKYDVLATSLIKYLTSVCSKQMNVPLFTDQVLSEIVSNIVVRNLTATDMDQELFEDNPTDYIRKDMEGSDQDTRRRCAVDLVRGLLKFFSDKVSALCIGYIGSMLETYRTTMDWRAKDAALHLVQAVAVKSTVNQAATEINPLINVLDIFSTHVFPEVNDPVIDARPIVKADAIKLICLFRQHFPRDLLLSLMPRMIAHLGSSHVVIQTYAAVCIDKFLSIKDKTPAGVSVQRLTEEDLGPLLQGLLAGLFAVLDNPNLPENDYVMKGIMRVLAVGGARVGPYTQLVLHKLNQTLERVCKNPVNPHFNHYMFESIALLIRNSCTGAASPEAAAALCTDFENMLFPPFQAVLQQNITEFTPYVFQVLAQLLSYRPGTASSPPYKALFSPLLSPVLWEQRGNVPALSDLFRAYITKAMPDILAGQHLAGVLGVFQKLLASKATEVFSYKLLNNLIMHCPMAALAPYAPQIFSLLLVRMQEERTPRFCKMFIHTMCLYASMDPQLLYRTIEGIEGGLVRTLVTKVWSQHGANCASGERSEIQHMLVGATKLMCATDVCQQPDAWGAALKFSLALMGSAQRQEQEASAEPFVDEDAAEAREFDSTYSRLAYAQFPDTELTGEMAAAPQFFASTLEALCRSRPGQYAPLLQQMLDAGEMETLQRALHSAGISGLS